MQNIFHITSAQDVYWLINHRKADIDEITITQDNINSKNEDIAKMENIISKHWNPCGCEMSARFLLVFFPILLLFSIAFYDTNLFSIKSLVIAGIGFIVFGIVGKIIGIYYSRLRYRVILNRLLDLLTT